MNGIHDMGGMQDMGPMRRETNEPVFHAAWEGRVFAMWWAVDGDWSNGEERYEKELIPPAEYLRISYYERVMAGLIGVMLKSGLLSQAELDTGVPAKGTKPPGHLLRSAEVAPMLAKGFPAALKEPVAARLHPGQRVRARNLNPEGHTRLPRYTRGKVGTVERNQGVFAFPDSEAARLGKNPQHVYSVRFSARELWGPQASPYDSVYVDMWDDYLESA